MTTTNVFDFRARMKWWAWLPHRIAIRLCVWSLLFLRVIIRHGLKVEKA